MIWNRFALLNYLSLWHWPFKKQNTTTQNNCLSIYQSCCIKKIHYSVSQLTFPLQYNDLYLKYTYMLKKSNWKQWVIWEIDNKKTQFLMQISNWRFLHHLSIKKLKEYLAQNIFRGIGLRDGWFFSAKGHAWKSITLLYL